MTGRKGTRWREKFVLWALAVALLLSLCTGCGNRIKPGDYGVGGTEAYAPDWTDVITDVEIDTLNVVLVIDTSASTLYNDPNRNGFETSCMFLNTLYASASQNESKRLPGSKRVNADVILYNDTTSLFSDTLMNLASNQTVSALKGFIRNAEIPIDGGGDSALAEALRTAVNILYNHSGGQEKLSERSLIMLFTDGYAGYVPQKSASEKQMPPQTAAVSSATPAGESDASAGSNGEVPRDNSFSYVPDFPDFGENQEQLNAALRRAKECNYAIYVLMSNLNKSDGGWDEFRKIANYTQRDLNGELWKVLQKHWDLFQGMSLNDFTWPEGYVLAKPTFLDDPMSGDGVFLNPEGGNNSDSKYGGNNKVNYLMAQSPTELMEFCATLAANMLSGSSAEKCVPTIETIIESTSDGALVEKDNLCYEIQVPDSGVSALMCFFFSKDGIEAVFPKGPDPENPGERKSYTLDLRKNLVDGWADIDNMTMRNDWYATPSGGKQLNIATLTIINPTPGLWNIYARGKNGNKSLTAYAKLLSGANVNISFAQGNGAAERPVTGGDVEIQVRDGNGNSLLSKEFYETLKTQCNVTRIPPWLPISGKSDIDELMQNFPAWLERTLSDFKKPEAWLTQMSGGKIEFTTGAGRDGNPALIGHFDAPLPGMYYVTLNMTSGKWGDSRIDYSKSFWVTYEPKTDYPMMVRQHKDKFISTSELLPVAWRKISNADASEIEELSLNIDMNSLRPAPSDLITFKIDAKHPETLVIYGNQKGEGTLSFDVTTQYGDKWTLYYDVIVY